MMKDGGYEYTKLFLCKTPGARSTSILTVYYRNIKNWDWAAGQEKYLDRHFPEWAKMHLEKKSLLAIEEKQAVLFLWFIHDSD